MEGGKKGCSRKEYREGDTPRKKDEGEREL
jgi:hypothetical protein